MQFQARYFDGHSARAHAVTATLLPPDLLLQYEDAELPPCSYALAQLRVQAPLGHGWRSVELPDGARLEAADLSALEAVLPRTARSAWWRGLHYLESHLGWVLLALLLCVASGWGALRYGIPALAERVAYATPPGVESELGKQVMQALDHKYGYFKPSQLSAARQAAIRQALAQFCRRQDTACPAYQLSFRDGDRIGANAMALPGGYMVVTDQLVALAQDDAEVVAVLAHELGHVQHRHAFRQSLQGALSGLLLTALTGEVDSIASAIPGILMQMRYSRDMERDADGFALHGLQRACIPPKRFADILERLAAQAKGDATPELLASHPDSHARVAPFIASAQDCRV